MKGTLTIRIDQETARMLARVARLSRPTQSQVARDTLRRQIFADPRDGDASIGICSWRGLATPGETEVVSTPKRAECPDTERLECGGRHE